MSHEKKAIKQLSKLQLHHAIVLCVSQVKALNELMYMVQNGALNQKFKRDFNILKKATENTYKEFEKRNKDNEILMNAYNLYADNFTEIVYKHIDEIQKN